MPWIRNLPNGRWAVTASWPDGERTTETYRTRREAEQAGVEIEEELREELEEGR